MANDLYTKVFTANFGCSTFMPDEELSRICDCAHDSLITSVDTLAKETHWNGSRKYGQHILDIISEVQPTPLPPTPPPTPITATTKAKPREMTCTNCQQTGHSSMFSLNGPHNCDLISAVKSVQSAVQTTNYMLQNDRRLETKNSHSLESDASFVRRQHIWRFWSIGSHGRVWPDAPLRNLKR